MRLSRQLILSHRILLCRGILLLTCMLLTQMLLTRMMPPPLSLTARHCLCRVTALLGIAAGLRQLVRSVVAQSLPLRTIRLAAPRERQPRDQHPDAPTCRAFPQHFRSHPFPSCRRSIGDRRAQLPVRHTLTPPDFRSFTSVGHRPSLHPFHRAGIVEIPPFVSTPLLRPPKPPRSPEPGCARREEPRWKDLYAPGARRYRRSTSVRVRARAAMGVFARRRQISKGWTVCSSS